ncbi:Ig-like domain-containing protein, partial [Candidimonas humi]
HLVHEDDGATVVGNALTDGTADSDQDGDTLHAVATTAPVAGDHGGLFSIDADGNVTFDPNGEFEGLNEGATKTTSFTYTVDDGHGGQSTATVTVTVTGVNDAPVVDLNGSADGTDSGYTWVEPKDTAPQGKAFMPDVTLTDVDNTDLSQVQLVVGGVQDGHAEDLVIGGRTFDLSSDTDLLADSIDGKFHIDYVATTHTFTITAIPATETDPGVATKADFESL